MQSYVSREAVRLQQQAKSEQSRLAKIGLYAIYALLIVAAIAIKADRFQSQIGKLSPAGEAVAAARSGSPLCAARDIKVVTMLEDAGAAGSAPDERLTEAYVTLMKAREQCASGRIARALAVYDGITLAPVQAAGR